MASPFPTGLATTTASSITGLLSGKQRVQFIQKGGGTVVSIDCTTKETHNRKSPPTKFPVENGTNVSDNIIIEPFSLEIEGIITDTPLSVINSAITAAASKVLPPVGIVAASTGLALFNALASSKSPSVQAYRQLLELQDLKQSLDVLTTLRRYENMYISDISAPRASDTGKVLLFNVSLTEIILVSPQTVNISKFDNAAISAAESSTGKEELDSAALQRFKQGQSEFHRATGT